MPITSSAQKALRQDRRRNQLNKRTRSKSKSAIDTFRETPTADNLSTAFRFIDRATKKNLMHKNKAARMKSRLSRSLTDTVSTPSPKETPLKKISPKKTSPKKISPKKK